MFPQVRAVFVYSCPLGSNNAKCWFESNRGSFKNPPDLRRQGGRVSSSCGPGSAIHTLVALRVLLGCHEPPFLLLICRTASREP